MFSPLIRACFLYSARRKRLSSTIRVLARLKVKSLATLLLFLLSLNLSEALVLIVEDRVLGQDVVERAPKILDLLSTVLV